jgi:hypothetical protein
MSKRASEENSRHQAKRALPWSLRSMDSTKTANNGSHGKPRQSKRELSRFFLLELPVEIRQLIFDFTLDEYRNPEELESCLVHISISRPRKMYPYYGSQKFRIGWFSVNRQIRIETIQTFLRVARFSHVKDQSLSWLQRWVAAGGTGLRLEDHIREISLTFGFEISESGPLTTFIKNCTKLRVLHLWTDLSPEVGCESRPGNNPRGTFYSPQTEEWANHIREGMMEVVHSYGFDDLRQLRGFENVTVGICGSGCSPILKCCENLLTAWMEEAMCQPEIMSTTAIQEEVETE